MQPGGKRLLMVAGAVVLTLLLYLAPQKQEKATEEAKAQEAPVEFSFDKKIQAAKSDLTVGDASRITRLEESLKSDPSSHLVLDSLGQAWDRFNQPEVA